MRIAPGLLAAWLVVAALPLRGADNVPLGSPDFSPSPEHPVGWRGDGSGRFPGATPPTLWGREFADQVNVPGNLVVIDTRQKKLAYQHFVDGYDVNGSITFGYTVSPTLAGKNIHLLDPVGYATILKPGADGTVLGHSKLENVTNLPASAPGKQEVFYAGMWFDGKRMFVHGDEYLYCIEEK